MFGFFGGPTFDPVNDIADLSGKVIIITGANGGLGYESLIHLAKHKPGAIYLCARSKEKYDAAMEGITAQVPDAPKFVKYLELDLTSLSSVASAASTFLAANSRLDILMNNAGIMATPPALTKEGYEIQFGTNHVGHALLTKKLMPLLQKTAAAPGSDVRIVNVTSEGHKLAPNPTGFVPEVCTTDMSTYSTWSRYGQSKLANNLFTTGLAKRYPQITSVVIHPGEVQTNLMTAFTNEHPWLKVLINPLFVLLTTAPTEGALNQTWASVAPVVGKSGTGKEGVKPVRQGGYYVPVTKDGNASSFARDEKLAEKLWEWTEAELAKQGY